MSLCFPEDMMWSLERKLLALQPGSRIVLMHCYVGNDCQEAIKPLDLFDSGSETRHMIPTEMSFGETPLYVFERCKVCPQLEVGQHVTRRGHLDTMD
eukprot:TRINITY_DN99637_c0_g1_i1.p2 TRINITY_DN99637_c0_g1~~TRINITY_DN99637_c0_g1_i1.p2  ORF type:complete len:111 (-),score=16.57 TRINITY_DN99637_c0_g1_i1:15-305(-)